MALLSPMILKAMAYSKRYNLSIRSAVLLTVSVQQMMLFQSNFLVMAAMSLTFTSKFVVCDPIA